MSPPPQQLHYTTFPELHEYALNNEKAAYQALPHHFLLRFEAIDQDKLAPSPKIADFTKFRLLLGLSKRSYKGESTAAYAFIGKKNQAHQVLLRLGSKHLKVKDFEGVEWEKPFDSIYDAYGQTERAGDKISMMAAFYFLATNRIPDITTHTSSFARNFTKLCGNIHVQDTEQVESRKITTNAEHGSGPYKDQTFSSKLSGHPSGGNCTSDLSSLAAAQKRGTGPKQEPVDEASRQLIEYIDQIENDHASMISSPTVWEDSKGSTVGQLPRTENSLLIDVAPTIKDKPLGQIKLQIPAEASQPVEAVIKAVVSTLFKASSCACTSLTK
jgi:hypothetical protein